jgi:hypothetical protein
MCSSPLYILCRFLVCKSPKSGHVMFWSLASVGVVFLPQTLHCFGDSSYALELSRKNVEDRRVVLERWSSLSTVRMDRQRLGGIHARHETPPITKEREVQAETLINKRTSHYKVACTSGGTLPQASRRRAESAKSCSGAMEVDENQIFIQVTTSTHRTLFDEKYTMIFNKFEVWR